MANHKQQGPPRQGVQDVTPLLIADLEARAAAGLATYGRPLQTFNGRNAAQDALEEALDLAQYLKQVVLEQEAAAVRWVTVVSPVVCWQCGHLVIATDDMPVEVVLDESGGTMSFFCSGTCANLPEVAPTPPAAGPVRFHAAMSDGCRPEERCHGIKPWTKLNGHASSIMVLCDTCGVSYDPTFPPVCQGRCGHGS